MAPAHSKELAWRVVFRYHWHDQTSAQICDPETGLDVSPHYVRDVLARYDSTGDVETHQGQGANHWDRRVFTYQDDLHIIQLLLETPRARLMDHRAQFILESGVYVAYSSFCGAVRRLGFTRKKVRPKRAMPRRPWHSQAFCPS